MLLDSTISFYKHFFPIRNRDPQNKVVSNIQMKSHKGEVVFYFHIKNQFFSP